MDYKKIKEEYIKKYNKYLLSIILFAVSVLILMILYFTYFRGIYYIIDGLTPIFFFILSMVFVINSAGIMTFRTVLKSIYKYPKIEFQSDNVVVKSGDSILKLIPWKRIDSILIKKYCYLYSIIGKEKLLVLFFVSDRQKFMQSFNYSVPMETLKKANEESGCLLKIEGRPEIMQEIEKYWSSKIEKI